MKTWATAPRLKTVVLIGSSNNTIEAKFLANATPVIGAESAKRAAAQAWALDTLPDVRALIALLA